MQSPYCSELQSSDRRQEGRRPVMDISRWLVHVYSLHNRIYWFSDASNQCSNLAYLVTCCYGLFRRLRIWTGRKSASQPLNFDEALCSLLFFHTSERKNIGLLQIIILQVIASGVWSQHPFRVFMFCMELRHNFSVCYCFRSICIKK